MTFSKAERVPQRRGAPVSLYTVSRELGHGSEDMVRRVYAHLGDVRHRSEVVEFRVEQHLDRLGDRLQRLGLVGPSVTRNVTAATPRPSRPAPFVGCRGGLTHSIEKFNPSQILCDHGWAADTR
jgi:hypothetical protein